MTQRPSVSSVPLRDLISRSGYPRDAAQAAEEGRRFGRLRRFGFSALSRPSLGELRAERCCVVPVPSAQRR
jgi:hypothetical protein